MIGVPVMPSSSEMTIPIIALEGHPPPAGFYVPSMTTSKCIIMCIDYTAGNPANLSASFSFSLVLLSKCLAVILEHVGFT